MNRRAYNGALMDDTARFFTSTIVGPPRSMVMGRRITAARMEIAGVEVDLRQGTHRLGDAWREDVLILPADDPWQIGRPQPHRKGLQRWLRSHSLFLALSGWTGLLALAGYLVARQF